MVRAGEVLDNPVTGERVSFRRTAAETAGESLEYELEFRPQGFLVREHLHPSQSERHEVLAGRLGLRLNGADQVLGPGDSVVVPAGTAHRLFAVGDDRVRVLFELRPALRSAELIETFVRRARVGKIDRRGNPRPLQLAMIAREFEAEGYATKPPLAVHRALLAPLAALGRRRERRGPSESLEYVFVDEWDVQAPREAVFDAIADARTYPLWWRPVYISAECDGDPEVGRVARQHFKGRLPYTLKTTSVIVALDRPHRIEAKVEGDLAGLGVWTLTPVNEGTHIRFDWRVSPGRAFLRYLTPVLRPAFRWNHNWAIARAIEGLEPYARRQAGSP
jgi:quercetin dioxygenase-like cupin family protein/uncharacterized protein YndB with AHSA1/START domain